MISVVYRLSFLLVCTMSQFKEKFINKLIYIYIIPYNVVFFEVVFLKKTTDDKR